MNLSFKFFAWRITWRINSKVEKLDSDERIIFLANELIKEIQDSGKSVSNPLISNGFGSVDIYLHNFDKGSPSLVVENIINGWRITGIPTIKTLEVN